jgi:DNA mismatch repair protein MutS2
MNEQRAASRPDIHTRSYVELEWPILLDRIAERALSPVGSQRIRRLTPATTLEAAEARMRSTAQAIAATEDESPIPIRSFPAVDETLGRVGKGSAATAEELLAVKLVLDLARSLRRYAQAQRAGYPELADDLDSDASLDATLAALEVAIEDDGRIADGASTPLRDARGRISALRSELVGKLNQLLRRYGEVLRDEYYAERDGRYVLPVRSDAHLRVPGIVLGSSASGGTLYVEPQELVEHGNRLKMAEADAAREEARVVAELSALLAKDIPLVRRAYEACANADVLACFVRFAERTRARAVPPDAAPRLHLKAFRHPLLALAGGDVIANDLVIESGRALVVSGPNAGGKTVSLKCLGLAAWMVRCGLPLPCDEGSVAGWFDPILADVGDDQSLLFSLSTFSAHIVKLRLILEHSAETALVLLDEVAAGTDPEEGAALAAAFIEALLDRGAAVAVTTHYERLKELPEQDSRFMNASVALDQATLAPTFHVTLGVPGPSSALTVAERFGIGSDIVARARQRLPEDAVRREQLLNRIAAERQALEAARAAAERDARRHAALVAELEAERRELRERERARLAEEARALTVDVRRARSELRELSAKLRHDAATADSIRDAQQVVNRAASKIAIGAPVTRATSVQRTPDGRAPAGAHEVAAGVEVYLPRLDARGRVLEVLAKDQYRVQVGSMKLVADLTELRLGASRAAAPKQEPRRTRALSSAPQASPAPVRTSQTTLDLRGVRVEDGLERIDGFIDALLRAGEPAGFVLHGHGTGAMKAAVREHLRSSAHVRDARPAERDEGGDAFTVFFVE